MPTPNIFDFDDKDLVNYEPEEIDKVLIEQPALYINHLRIARSVDKWAGRLESSPEAGFSEEYQKGYVRALREIAAHLRQADYVEGGVLIVEQH